VYFLFVSLCRASGPSLSQRGQIIPLRGTIKRTPLNLSQITAYLKTCCTNVLLLLLSSSLSYHLIGLVPSFLSGPPMLEQLPMFGVSRGSEVDFRRVDASMMKDNPPSVTVTNIPLDYQRM
jgi:hypothetical protein